MSGNILFFEEVLADLSGLPLDRVANLVHGGSIAGFRALFDKSGLPAMSYPAFREAVTTLQEEGFVGDPAGAIRLKRRMVERVLTGCADGAIGEIEPLMLLLRRFAAEAARDEARILCEELVESDVPPPPWRIAA